MMWWIIAIEASLTVLCFGCGIVSAVAGRSWDEDTSEISETFFTAAAIFVLLLIVSKVGWLGWSMIFG